MNKKDALTGIAQRAAGRTPVYASTMKFSLLDTDEWAFKTVLHGLIDEFPFVWHGADEFQQRELDAYEGLFSLLVEEIEKFPENIAHLERSLIRIIALGAFLEKNDELWPEISRAKTKVPPQFIDTLAKLFSDSRIDSAALLKDGHLNSEQANIVLREVADKDWRAIEWTLERLWSLMWLPIKQNAGTALYHLDRSRLALEIEKAQDYFDIASYIAHTPSSHHLDLAPSSSNWTFKFWALQWSARKAADGERQFDEVWEALLVEASNVPAEWARWMLVLNEFPVRYPQLQQALGRTLSKAPPDALTAYVAAVSMSDHSRPAVTEALEVFRNGAPEPHRKRLWIAAYERWLEWDFGTTEHSKSLFKVQTSPLDHAVVGYFVECASADERTAVIRDLTKRARKMEQDWHADISPAITERFKLISAFQMIAHAEDVLSRPPAWLPDVPLYQPPWEDGSLYRSFKYDRELSKPAFLTATPSTEASNPPAAPH